MNERIRVYTPPFFIKIISLCLICSLLFTIPFLIVGNFGVVMVFGILMIADGILFLIFKRYEILIENGVVKITPSFGRKKVVSLSEVEKIIVTKQGHLKIIANGKKIGKIDGMACGYGEFILFARKHFKIE